jgi:hypothetical protein
VEPTFNRVRVIKIQNMEITKEILGILSKTDEGKIESIELRNIVFDSEDTGNESWSLVIQRGGGGKVKEINVNIVGNDIAGYIEPAKNYRNELVRGYRI